MSSHMIRGRQLSRDTEHRKSLRRSLVQSLFEHGKIRTTLPKAKEVRAFAEKLITLARTGTHPGLGRVTLGQLLAAWVVHDLGHVKQVVRAMARQYREAG